MPLCEYCKRKLKSSEHRVCRVCRRGLKTKYPSFAELIAALEEVIGQEERNGKQTRKKN